MSGPATIAVDGAFHAGIAGGRLTVKRAAVSLAASGDLVAAVTGKQILVISYLIVAAGAVTAKFQSGATTDLTGAMTMATGSVNTPGNATVGGCFVTAVGEKLNLVLGGAVQVSGWLTYVEVG